MKNVRRKAELLKLSTKNEQKTVQLIETIIGDMEAIRYIHKAL